ncbi:hypothetical protein M758_2G022300 [Ceratodon purpureus]|uniref:Uncharacterized protein n=1 Tax=Ceratodon purpureus TaxID=3225 RepID=A0A8T0IRZ9_CERPU|nr:hypothetical protein KC19_2G023100 [Ceratodon purpureus]KAG0625027.1 hypothetical protein M758_2G022300 [Ceratodon purpureus]
MGSTVGMYLSTVEVMLRLVRVDSPTHVNPVELKSELERVRLGPNLVPNFIEADANLQRWELERVMEEGGFGFGYHLDRFLLGRRLGQCGRYLLVSSLSQRVAYFCTKLLQFLVNVICARFGSNQDFSSVQLRYQVVALQILAHCWC